MSRGEVAYARGKWSLLTPIPALQRQDADVVLRLITKDSVLFNNPIDDPMFSAHRKVDTIMNDGIEPRYLSDFPGAGLACAAQVS